MQDSTSYCTTSLNYAGPTENEPTRVTIADGRSALDTLDFEECGFTLLEHHSRVSDWRDEQGVNEINIPEIERLAKEYTGCDHAIVYPAVIRSPDTAKVIFPRNSGHRVKTEYEDPTKHRNRESYDEKCRLAIRRDRTMLHQV